MRVIINLKIIHYEQPLTLILSDTNGEYSQSLKNCLSVLTDKEFIMREQGCQL